MMLTCVTNCDIGRHSSRLNNKIQQMWRVWCPGCGYPPQHPAWGKYGLKIWWKWIKLTLTGHRAIYKLFWYSGLWVVCPAPVWHWRCRHTQFVPGEFSFCSSQPTFCQIFNSSDIGTKTFTSLRDLSWNLKVTQIDAIHNSRLPSRLGSWQSNYNYPKWIASGWQYKVSSPAIKTVQITKEGRLIL